MPSPGSCLAGRGSVVVVEGSTAWPRSSASYRARRSPRRCSSQTCWRFAFEASARAISTNCAPPVRWYGSEPDRWGLATGASGCCSGEQASLLLTDEAETLDDPIHAALRAHLADRGASFWPDLVVAAQAAELPYDQETVLADAVGPGVGRRGHQRLPRRRCVRWSRAGRPAAAKSPRAARGRRRRPRPGQLPRLGPPTAAGRWSLVAPLRRTGAEFHRSGPRPGPATTRPLWSADPRGCSG